MTGAVLTWTYTEAGAEVQKPVVSAVSAARDPAISQHDCAGGTAGVLAGPEIVV